MRSRPLVLLLALALLAVPAGAAPAQTPASEPTPSPVPSGDPAPASPDGADAANLDVDDRVARILASMTLREKVGQLFTSRVYGYRAKAPAPRAQRSNERYLGVADARQLLARYPVGGIVYFDYAGNLQRPEQIARLSNGIQRAALEAGTVPVLISTDQEHGLIERLGPPATRFPGAMALGATRDPELAREAARITGEELRAVGIRQNLAPVADVNSNPANPVIGVRAFGSRPGPVARMVAAQVTGLQDDAGVAATVKHFPGHGDTTLDSHLDLPTIGHDTATWWAVDAPPFEAAIEAGVEVVMTAHVRVPALDPRGRPATLSGPILSGVLREQMGYDGVIMTDSLTMAGVRARYRDARVPVMALKAGADILADPLDLPLAFDAVMRAVRSGDIAEDRIDRSVERILRLKERLGLLDEPMVKVEEVGSLLGPADHDAVAQAVGEAAITILRDRGRRLPLPSGSRVALTGVRPEGEGALAGSLRRMSYEVDTAWTGLDPSREQVARALRAARRSDATVVVTKHLGPHPRQRELVRRVLASGRRVILVFGSSPYDVTWFPNAPTQLLSYSTVPASMRGLAGVLGGRTSARGTLPVRIPRPGGGGTLYPFGHGGVRADGPEDP